MPTNEGYQGGFHKSIRTGKPFLLVGDEFDVITPAMSAKNMSASFKDNCFLGEESARGKPSTSGGLGRILWLAYHEIVCQYSASLNRRGQGRPASGKFEPLPRCPPVGRTQLERYLYAT